MKKIITALIISILVLSFPPQIKRSEAGIITNTIIIAALGFIAYKIFILCIEIQEFKQALLNELIKHRDLKEKVIKELEKFINDPRWEQYNEKAIELLDLIKSGNYEYKPVDLNISELLKNPNFNLEDMLTNLRNRFPNNPIVIPSIPIDNPIITNPDIPVINPPVVNLPPKDDNKEKYSISFNYNRFWRDLSMDSEFISDFNDRNIKDMEQGFAPYAPSYDSYGLSRGRFEIHFKNGKPTYNMRNIEIVSPKKHYEIHKNDNQTSNSGNSINDIISRTKDLSQNWEDNYSELRYLFGNVHPDFYSFTFKYNNEKINNLLNEYSQKSYDPYSEKEILKNIYNKLLNADYSNGSAEYLASIIDNSFFLDKSSIYFVYLPEEIETNRKNSFSFEEFYTYWKNN